MRTVLSRRPVGLAHPHFGRSVGVVRRRWLPAWWGLAALGVVNGAVRETTYAGAVGDHAAHQLSTFTLIAMIVTYTWWVQQRWPLASTPEALKVGALWLALTVAFEFGFGHYVAGASWSTLLTDYDLAKGNLWVLVLLTTGLAPVAVRRAASA
jgi:hypothetical protein